MRLVHELAFARYKRLTYLWRGWSSRSALLLDPQHRDAAVAQLKLDYEAFLSLQAAAQTGVGKELLERSSFNLLPVRQIVEALPSRNWICDEVGVESVWGFGHAALEKHILSSRYVCAYGVRQFVWFAALSPSARLTPCGQEAQTALALPSGRGPESHCPVRGGAVDEWEGAAPDGLQQVDRRARLEQAA